MHPPLHGQSNLYSCDMFQILQVRFEQIWIIRMYSFDDELHFQLNGSPRSMRDVQEQESITLISLMMNCWWAGESTGKPLALLVKIFVGRTTARTGSPSHRFWACSLGTSADSSIIQGISSHFTAEENKQIVYLTPDRLCHDNRAACRSCSTTATVVVQHHRHLRSNPVPVSGRRTSTEKSLCCLDRCEKVNSRQSRACSMYSQRYAWDWWCFHFGYEWSHERHWSIEQQLILLATTRRPRNTGWLIGGQREEIDENTLVALLRIWRFGESTLTTCRMRATSAVDISFNGCNENPRRSLWFSYLHFLRLLSIGWRWQARSIVSDRSWSRDQCHTVFGWSERRESRTFGTRPMSTNLSHFEHWWIRCRGKVPIVLTYRIINSRTRNAVLTDM